MQNKCTFTTNITEEIDCAPDGKFDDNGFPINRCLLFPCEKFKNVVEKVKLETMIIEMKTILKSLIEARKENDIENWFDHYFKRIDEIVSK